MVTQNRRYYDFTDLLVQGERLRIVKLKPLSMHGFSACFCFSFVLFSTFAVLQNKSFHYEGPYKN